MLINTLWQRKMLRASSEVTGIRGLANWKKTGAFLLPGFAKFVVIKKSATKERAGINPFTLEPTVFKAKPARKIVRARPGRSKRRGVSKATCVAYVLICFVWCDLRLAR